MAYRAEFQTMKTGRIPTKNVPFQSAGRRKKKTKKIDPNEQLNEHIKLLHKIHKQHGSGFLSGLLHGVSNVLGTIGKPIFDIVPGMSQYSGLLGDNSAYNLASQGLEKIGLGRKKRVMRKGKGFFSSLKKGLSSIKSAITNVKDRIVHTFTGRDKLAPTARKLLENHGNEKVISLTICREPIVPMVEKVMNFISLGKLNDAKNDLQYDRLFHLYCFVKTDKGTEARLEKNEIIGLQEKSMGTNSKRETMNIPITNDLTLNELMENTKKYMGDKFLSYSASENNCQHFIDGVLSGNHLNNSDIKKFVLQDSASIFKHLPSFMKGFSDKITGLAGKLDVLKHGYGKKKKLLIKKKSIKSKKSIKKRRIIHHR